MRLVIRMRYFVSATYPKLVMIKSEDCKDFFKLEQKTLEENIDKLEDILQKNCYLKTFEAKLEFTKQIDRS
jgi:hypothetical protein